MQPPRIVALRGSAPSQFGTTSPRQLPRSDRGQSPTGTTRRAHCLLNLTIPLPGNNKNSQDPTVVFPPSYDTVPHSAYILHEIDTFSDSQVQNQAAYPGALLLVYDGFTLN